MYLDVGNCVIRNWAAEDLAALVRYANNRKIWINVRDRFPHPYLEEHGRDFLKMVSSQSRPTTWAIAVQGEAVGGIGLMLLTDIERVSAEVGYWLGEPCWGKGIATDAVRAVTAAALRDFDLLRIFALPFADNAASIRVLEKAGYTLEGRMPQSAIKDGTVRDQLMYGAYKGRWNA